MPGKPINAKQPIIIEVAAFTPNAALTAWKAGADRIELCSGYAEGGLSPSAATIAMIREKIPIPVHVMLRPRIGDFVYNRLEKEIILRDIAFCRQMNLNGVVAGALTPQRQVDRGFIETLVDAAFPMQVTFHRAFDLCLDMDEALEVLIDHGVSRILTSGGKQTCIKGIEKIAELVEKAAGRIIIMPGGGISPENIEEVLSGTGVHEVHLSGKMLVSSTMKPHHEVSFTSVGEVNDYQWFECNMEIIKAVQLKVKDMQ